MHIQNTAVKNINLTSWLSLAYHVFAMSVLALRFQSSNSCMGQFTTAERKFPLSLSLRRKTFSGIGSVCGCAWYRNTDPARAY